MKQSPLNRRIRSYVLRQARTSPAQQAALKNFWPNYGLEFSENYINLEEVFGRNAATVIEIGFGNGSSLFEMAEQQPDTNFIGIEVHGPGVGVLLQKIAAAQLTNIKIYQHDAIEVLNNCITNHSIAAFQIFFPDPWHKKRHHKRRLVQQSFCELLWQKLVPGGYVHLATDWQDYAAQMMDVFSSHQRFNNIAGIGNYLDEKAKTRPSTKFEQRGLGLGHQVWDLMFQTVK